ncbi:PP2C family protein-serine/threonine phosphatase [Gephyromycinifex aptenodytis]|uniref:PP2C family protein-serine/threonine phosphatase n=1 Tax=Gephyromycinifex aptenodytis TaxID=2716227 RepID=UPI0014481443|nr:protein phosphatase 2C domain-containing protein [Gephyromycinifex aptenodytis]
MSQQTPPPGETPAQDPRPDAPEHGLTLSAPSLAPRTRGERDGSAGVDAAGTAAAAESEVAGSVAPEGTVAQTETPPAQPTAAGAQAEAATADDGEAARAEGAAQPPIRCQTCAALVEDHPFCEQCGASLHVGDQAGTAVPAAAPTPAAPPKTGRDQGGLLVLGADPGTLTPLSQAIPEAAPAGEPCPQCGGSFADGYCENCGAPQPDPRAHQESNPAPWVAGVCDIGVRHSGNQDAMALDVFEGARAALIVCDGVSSAARSEEASQAAADAALEVLAGATSRGLGVAPGVVPALSARLTAATDAAAQAVAHITGDVPHSDITSASNPSCTFVAAVIEGDEVVVGSVGDSRAYWLPDAGEPMRLTTDDSWAEEQIRLGASRAEAERGPQAHTITRWLGVDAPDHTPVTTALTPDRPGWLLLCSDGLWNYASEPQALAEVFREVCRATGAAHADLASTAAGTRDAAGTDLSSGAVAAEMAASDVADQDNPPLALARGLVDWANAQGGHDNITVALARLGDAGARETRPAAQEGERVIGEEDPLGTNPTIVISEAGSDPTAPTVIEQNANHG